ncbi:efflux RND transporter permease subunit [Thioalkalivibrio sp. XN8]|uniref:efflux RND transporter permease subunit n=1 Tax=Thioalkalivibrio sp. XN8 TaxID=2712863 RepID=UPI0013EB2BF9|nr:efflux RND transporter permease subunit [Thioalkalivibrio sp. XN8]NGP54202.1 efflux RND transporter permease subunit [Thioalkalivibrio sp. XN8]
MSAPRAPLDGIIRFFLEQKLVVALLVLALVVGGVAVAPFDWKLGALPRAPVPVDAIPDLGENQQIVFTEWPGRSPQDIDDQVTYPLTVALLGVPGVKEVRSSSLFGFSMIFLIFEEGIEFYWSRSRILEKLSSLPAGLLPEGVSPALGPDATALGQVYWYTLEGRGRDGQPLGGWDLDELRSVQDWYVRYGLLAAEGISEVASIGGYVREYQVDVDPDALRANGVTLQQVFAAVRQSNLDVGARVVEINSVEYLVRGLGFIESLADLEEAVVRVGPDRVPVRVRDVATVQFGPAQRRGALTIGGAEAVGGVVIVRENYNPLQAIQNVKAQIEELAPGLPAKAVIDWTRTSRAEVERFAREQGLDAFVGAGLDQDAWQQWLRATPAAQWPEWVDLSQLEIVSFYDRTGLIYETLGTLNEALVQQVLVTVLVVIVMLLHLRAALVISAALPLAVLFGFIMMKLAGVDANIVALAGIAIAIGTIVDMSVIVTENVLKHLQEAPPDEPRIEVVFRATSEVASAILAALSTTVISFLPVFTMTGAEGKMFVPLAFTKTFVLLGAMLLTLTVVPAAAHVFIAGRDRPLAPALARALLFGLAVAAAVLALAALWAGWMVVTVLALLLLAATAWRLWGDRLERRAPALAAGRARAGAILRRAGPYLASVVGALVVWWWLGVIWEPLGPEAGRLRNLLFVGLVVGGVLGSFWLLLLVYGPVLRWCLAHKLAFSTVPVLVLLLGLTTWLGFDRTFGVVPAAAQAVGLDPRGLRDSRPWQAASHAFPGLGREFMPPLDEGAFLWMPTTMPHASIGEVLEVLKYQDQAILSVPEVELVAGKLGRAETALDPAPISMIESIIHYKPEYALDEEGRPYRQWRDHIRSPQDIWDEIVAAAQLPGVTSAPKLQPIETRLVMLQTGMRAPMGLKVRAPDLATMEAVAIELERELREVPAIRAETVSAERVVGKPYLEIDIDRVAIARYGLRVADVQEVVTVAIGGRTVTTTVEGRERYPVRVRYPRELRTEIDELESVLVAAPDGTQVPLRELATVSYTRGPQMIRSENTFLTAYVTFGGQPGVAEVEVVEQAQAHLAAAIEAGRLVVPSGVSWRFAGNYENQLRAMQTLSVVVPGALLVIFLILYFQFRRVATTLVVFSSIALAWAGGFILVWLYGQPWFADFSVLGANLRELFGMGTVNLSVAVWVGFLALFGIAVDNGVVLATYLRQSFEQRRTRSVADLRAATVAAGLRRLRPCLMTTATTVLALLPVLTSTGRGSDIMIPMALPSVGGMMMVLLSLFTVPVLYCLVEELRLKGRLGAYRDPAAPEPAP